MACKKTKAGICIPDDAGKISRRRFLETGVSMTGYMSAAQLFPSLARAQDFTLQRRLVWVNMDGGWDILEITDPKTKSTSGIDMSYPWSDANALAGSGGSEKIGRWLPNIAEIGEDVVVVRGLAMGTTAHDAGNVYMDTGVLSNAGNVNAASIPAIVASESDATIPIIQLDDGNEPLTDRGLLNPVSVVRAQNLDLYKSMYPESSKETRLRLQMLEYLRDSATRAQNRAGTNDRLTSIINAEAKVRGQIESDVGSKLSTNADDLKPYQTRNAPQNLDQNLASAFALTSKLLINNIVSCVNLGITGFDTHQNQTARMEPLTRGFDFIVRTFVDVLRENNALENTLIVLYSDFGRTPKINGNNGRDHWPVGGALLIGGNIEGGRAVGGTDSNLLAKDTNTTTGEVGSGEQLNPTHLCGSVLELCLGSSYMQYRSYLESIAALTRVKTS